MTRQRSQNWFWLQAIVVLACAVLVAPVAAQNQTALAAKKRASADITARLQAQAIADAAQRAAIAREQAVRATAVTVVSVAPVEPSTHAAAAKVSPSPLLSPPVVSSELAIAQHIYQGHLRCELGTSVHVEADAERPGFFHVQGNGFRYRMYPVLTSTGALRLEDKAAGAVWLQLGNKSMLMDQKKGRRMADECAHPDQVAFVQATQNRPPTELFDTTGMGRPLD